MKVMSTEIPAGNNKYRLFAQIQSINPQNNELQYFYRKPLLLEGHIYNKIH